jgi:hypothetical protein
MRSVVLGLMLAAGLAAAEQAQPLFATSPPPNRPADTSSCCYATAADAEYEGELELQGGNYYAYFILEIDSNHWELFLWNNN